MNEINVKKKYNENTKQSLYKLEKKYKELAKEEHIQFISLVARCFKTQLCRWFASKY